MSYSRWLGSNLKVLLWTFLKPQIIGSPPKNFIHLSWATSYIWGFLSWLIWFFFFTLFSIFTYLTNILDSIMLCTWDNSKLIDKKFCRWTEVLFKLTCLRPTGLPTTILFKGFKDDLSLIEFCASGQCYMPTGKRLFFITINFLWVKTEHRSF